MENYASTLLFFLCCQQKITFFVNVKDYIYVKCTKAQPKFSRKFKKRQNMKNTILFKIKSNKTPNSTWENFPSHVFVKYLILYICSGPVPPPPVKAVPNINGPGPYSGTLHRGNGTYRGNRLFSGFYIITLKVPLPGIVVCAVTSVQLQEPHCSSYHPYMALLYK